eukprot:Platyproteum_vivax@DN16420_c0_g1_i1.p1
MLHRSKQDILDPEVALKQIGELQVANERLRLSSHTSKVLPLGSPNTLNSCRTGGILNSSASSVPTAKSLLPELNQFVTATESDFYNLGLSLVNVCLNHTSLKTQLDGEKDRISNAVDFIRLHLEGSSTASTPWQFHVLGSWGTGMQHWNSLLPTTIDKPTIHGPIIDLLVTLPFDPSNGPRYYVCGGSTPAGKAELD